MKKIAVIELGTLQVKLTIADVLANEAFVITDQVIDAVRVATDLHTDNLIKPSRIQELIVILKSYRAFCSSKDIQDVTCVASFEYADSKNQRSFIEELYNQSGFKFRILEKDEQLLNNYTAVINTLDIPKGLIIAVGGNKTQILNYNRRNLLNQHTFDFGSCNLAEETFDGALSPEEYCKKMLTKFSEQIKGLPWLNELDLETQIVGVGSSFLSLGKLSRRIKKYTYDKEHNYSMLKSDFEDVYNLVRTLDIDKTKKLKGISSDRADVLASGLCIIKAIVEKTNVDNLVISANSVTEGILFNQACPVTLEKPITDILGYSLAKIDKYYNNYSTNTEQVYTLAMLLYKQFKVLHKLSRTYVRVLRVASILHDSGKRVESTEYTKNGFNVVLDSDLYGVTHREQVLAGFVVACQNLEYFNMTEWAKYKELFTEEDLEGVRKLGVIVRLADALDKFNKKRVLDISCDILGDSVIMKTIVESPAELEIREGLKCQSDFVKAFKKHLEIL